MEKRTLCLVLMLALLLTGCGPKEPPVTPAPEPSPSVETSPSPSLNPTPAPSSAAPRPDPKEDPKGYVMSWVDTALGGEKIYLRFWIHPGSGPTPSIWPAEEYAQTVRTMFEELDWDSARVLTWEEAYADEGAPEDIPGMYSVTLNDEDWRGEGYIQCGLNAGMVHVAGDDDLYFFVGGAEELCTKLTDLEPSVYVNLGRVRVPAQKSEEATLKLYLETALERTKELGHITDYELRAYAVTSPEWEGEGAPPGFQYTATYAYKPAHPESAHWKDYAFDADGWVVATIEEQTEGLLYDERDGCYGMY